MSHHPVVDAVGCERAVELKRLLDDGGDPNEIAQEYVPLFGPVRALSHCFFRSNAHPECARILIEAGADLHWNPDEREKLLDMFTDASPVLEYAPNMNGLKGDFILTLDILKHNEPTFWASPVDPNSTQTNGERMAQNLRSLALLNAGAEWSDPTGRFRREREGLLKVLEGRYWSEEYNGRNPFLDATTAEEVLALLLDGAANNEHGQADITRLRSIKPALRRPVMALLSNHVIDMRSGLGELDVAVASKKAYGPIASLGGLLDGHGNNVIFPHLAKDLGLVGRPFVNAQNALTAFDQLATGAFENEYNAWDW